MDAVAVYHRGFGDNRGASDRRRRNIHLGQVLIKLCLIKLCGFRLERLGCLPCNDVKLGTRGRGDDRCKEAFGECRRHRPGFMWLGQEPKRKFSTQHR